jgi:signal transduction histidine kinase
MEAGTTDWHMEELLPGPIFEQALAAARGLFTKSPNIALEVDIEKDLPAIRVDRDRLIQVIVNLMSNAVKFCNKERGLVRFRVARQDSAVRVDVADNGIGIAPVDQARIFERFQQAGDTLTDKPEGTGLGLPISRQILQRFGGELWVESELGRGSTFSFRIPIVPAIERSRVEAVERMA